MIFQKAHLADHFFPDVKAGEKVRTLRWNEPKISVGFLRFEGSEDQSLTTIVYTHNVSFGKAEQMAPLYEMSPQELINGMNIHYTNVPHDAEFMLVEYLSPKETKKIKGYSEFETLSAIS